jgi:hypothetical protein
MTTGPVLWLQSLSFDLNVRCGQYSKGRYIFVCMPILVFRLVPLHKGNRLITQRKFYRARTKEGTHTHTCARARLRSCRLQNFGYLFSEIQLWNFIGAFSFNFVLISHYAGSQWVQNFKEVQLLDMMLQRDRKLVQRCLFDCYKSLVKRLLEMLKWLAYGLLVILHW